ncbi:molybdate ABC transporter substrate-binding protein [Methylonatrum kenyense]|uniref:molybdate ABC transporter substrate-binding protein n=1 Tax=Methylonatrum kenyense TaxID=455253 RepID=UPI0020BF64A5|nr:molybdate ABC transporter substrate-binding protein [Methylonatrum kenyense]MCK8514722.1 molybdate ABC transporter substrate-binding protein [Methylonatrum kenyense]
MRRLLLVFCLLLALPVQAERPPIVAAASDLQVVLPLIAERFEAETGHALRLQFGSSGNFRRQIAQGAPFELYLSADESYVHALAESGHLRNAGALYAIGRLAVVGPVDENRQVALLESLAARLEDGSLRRFALANPEHAPYGQAAREALETAGLWNTIQPRLILGDDVAQSTRHALSPDTDGGIVAYPLVKPRAERIERPWQALDPALHAPLNQRMALTTRAGPVAGAFFEFILSPASRELLEEHGFGLPEPD